MNDKLGERMARLEEKVDNINDKLDDFIGSAESRFASKLTEKIVYGLVAMVLIAFVTKLLNLW